MLSCRDISTLATAYTEGTLSFRQRLGFRLHLAMCEFCRRYLRQLKATVGALRDMPTPATVPTEIEREAALKVFRGWKKPP